MKKYDALFFVWLLLVILGINCAKDAKNTGSSGSAPAAPSNVWGSGMTAWGSFTLFWQDNSNNEDGFRVEQMIGNGGTWITAQQTGPNVTSAYVSSSGSSGTTNYFRVVAYNANGSNASSVIVKITP